MSREDSATTAAAGGSLQSCLTLTREMLACAQAGDWERVAALQARRRRLLAAVPAGPSPADAPALRALRRLNAELAALGEARRAELQDSLRRRARGRRAAAAFIANDDAR